MLKYAKLILTKVSFDAHLFEKELRKAIKGLRRHELPDLESWCIEQFGHLYQPLINKCFRQVSFS